jgi:hypothetical protein
MLSLYFFSLFLAWYAFFIRFFNDTFLDLFLLSETSVDFMAFKLEHEAFSLFFTAYLRD